MITYPVDIENTKWSVHDSDTDTIVVSRGKWPRLDGEEIPGLKSNLTLLLEIEGARPTFDPTIEKIEKKEPVKDLDANVILTEWHVVPHSAVQIAQILRETQRKAMRDDWDALPVHLRGPYRPEFEIVNLLLDEGDDEAAVELLDSIEPTTKVKGNNGNQTEFDAVKAGFAAKLAALTPQI